MLRLSRSEVWRGGRLCVCVCGWVGGGGELLDLGLSSRTGKKRQA